MSSDAVIAVQGLHKSYAQLEAVKGIDFQVQSGEVFGILGPNGAGKTSTVEILEGLRPRSGGEALVLGYDPERQKQQLKDRIGVCLQATNLPAKIRAQEALDLFASFYMPYIILVICLAHFIYHMPWPADIPSLLIFISIGLIAFRAIGMVIASVANTMQEGTIRCSFVTSLCCS